MYFNYKTNSFTKSPASRTRLEQISEPEIMIVRETEIDENGEEHEVEREVERLVEKTIEVEIPIPEDCIEIDDSVCEELFAIVKNSDTPKAIFAGENGYPEIRDISTVTSNISEEEQNAIKILELKKKLASTDYYALKRIDGFLTEEEYAPIKAQRQAWRDEINELEKITTITA